jgi:hypothetical protein
LAKFRSWETFSRQANNKGDFKNEMKGNSASVNCNV